MHLCSRNIACVEQHPSQTEAIPNKRINDGDLPLEVCQYSVLYCYTCASVSYTCGFCSQVDWRVKNVFTPVKSETRHCISSYALATTATVEAYLALDRGELIELSYEQVRICRCKQSLALM